MEFVELEVNNIKYILIDEYEYQGKIIYHFGSRIDEIFCTLSGKKYNPILDKNEIKRIKEKFDLIDDDVLYSMIDRIKESAYALFYRKFAKKIKMISKNERDTYINEQVKNFESINDNLGIGLDLNQVQNALNRVKVLTGRIKKASCRAFYNQGLNVILSNKEYIDNEEIDAKRVRLHETIHCMTYTMGKKMLDTRFYSFFEKGLLEGQTESLVERLFESRKSCNRYRHERLKNRDVITRIKYNFSDETSYKPLVCIVRQMENAIGMNSAKSIVEGSRKFEKEFIHQYGLEAYVYMAYRTRRILTNIPKNRDKTNYFKETQDSLLKIVFEKDFKNISSVEDAEKYLKRLQKFETERARISQIDYKEKSVQNDEFFKKFYNEKFHEIGQLLLNKGYAKQEIVARLEKYKYRQQEFKPMFLEEEVRRKCEDYYFVFLAKEVINGNMTETDDKIDVYYAMKNNGGAIIFLKNRENNKELGHFIMDDIEECWNYKYDEPVETDLVNGGYAIKKWKPEKGLTQEEKGKRVREMIMERKVRRKIGDLRKRRLGINVSQEYIMERVKKKNRFWKRDIESER